MPRFLLALLSLAVVLMCAPAHAQHLPTNTQSEFYFAHITDGGPDTDRWTTQFRFVNFSPGADSPAVGTLEFFAQDGTPLTVDFGSGPGSVFPVTVPINGSLRLETIGSSATLQVGFVKATFDYPVQATSEFRNWRSGAFTNGASVDGIPAALSFLYYADEFTGIAIANPNATTALCNGTFNDTSGGFVAQAQIVLSTLNQTAFTLNSFLSLAPGSVGSFWIECDEMVVSLAIAGDNRGITSSLPAGGFSVPVNHPAGIQKTFKYLYKLTNSAFDVPVTQPTLVIASNQTANITVGSNSVTIELALAELLSDSPSELAFVLAHSLSHIVQASSGFFLDPNDSELDADLLAIAITILAGYDPYSGAGALGKLVMASSGGSFIVQGFEDNIAPNASFTNRLNNIYSGITMVCSIPDFTARCQQFHDLTHTHLLAPVREDEAWITQ